MLPHVVSLYVLVFVLAVLGIALVARGERQRVELATLRKWAEAAELLIWPRSCRVCGCTDDEACISGCWWAEDDLCSSCSDDLASSLEGGRRQ